MDGENLKSATETYTVESSLGCGGAGEVYLVHDDIGTCFAAKVLRSGLSKQKLKRFHNELMFGVREDHPHLIKVLDFGRSDSDTPFYIMPLATGTLRSMMKAGIEEQHRLALFANVLDGIEAAHLKGVFHRDLKPENLLYFSDARQLRVADFGIAHFEEDQLHTPVDTLPAERLANFEYAAPEQRRQGVRVDFQADIFSLGLILAELFTGVVPHGIGAAKVSDISPSFGYLDDLIEKMRQQDPARRPSSIREIKNELISRQNTFIEAQKIDQLRKTVVKDSEATDPLVNDPPTIVDVKFTGSALNIKLSCIVSPKWVQVFQNAPLGGLLGYGPAHHGFSHDVASIQVPERLAQQVLDQFKFYLQQVNEMYARQVKQEEKSRIENERFRLAAEIQRQESLAAIQRNLGW
jgi:serine/threonine protein kinase